MEKRMSRRNDFAERGEEIAWRVARKRYAEAAILLQAFRDGLDTYDIALWAEMPEASVVLLLDSARFEERWPT
jgi:hypothetical protein